MTADLVFTCDETKTTFSYNRLSCTLEKEGTEIVFYNTMTAAKIFCRDTCQAVCGGDDGVRTVRIGCFVIASGHVSHEGTSFYHELLGILQEIIEPYKI